MFEKINKKKLAGIALAGVLTISGTTYAFAADQSSSGTKSDAVSTATKSVIEAKKLPDDVFKDLVNDGTITQSQADAIIKALTPNGRFGTMLKTRINPMGELIASGTITQAQADEINKALKTGIEANKTMDEIFKELVNAGTIKEAQKEAILKLFPNKNLMERPIIEKFENRGEHKGFLNNLVTEGTITQAQADSYASAIKEAIESKKLESAVLKELVTAGTITQAQADAMLKSVVPFEGKGSFMRFGNNPLEKLVEAGTITEAQADAVNAALKAALNPSSAK